MEDYNDILVINDIVKAVSSNGGISGTTAVIVDAEALFGKRSLKKINLKINTRAQYTQEVCWLEDFLQVTKSSNVSDPEIIHQVKHQNYENNDIFVSVVSVFKSVNPALWLKEEVYNEPVVATIYVMSSKENSY